jgi:hypothetical protein
MDKVIRETYDTSSKPALTLRLLISPLSDDRNLLVARSDPRPNPRLNDLLDLPASQPPRDPLSHRFETAGCIPGGNSISVLSKSTLTANGSTATHPRGDGNWAERGGRGILGSFPSGVAGVSGEGVVRRWIVGCTGWFGGFDIGVGEVVALTGSEKGRRGLGHGSHCADVSVGLEVKSDTRLAQISVRSV